MLTKLKRTLDTHANNLALDILILSVLIVIVDFLNIDNSIYQIVCLNLKSWHIIIDCQQYYDLPLWQVLTSFGTILAGLFAYQAINQQNKQLHANQTPIIVTPFGLGVNKDSISIKNVGKGVALKIFVTLDYEGKNSAQKTSSPDLSYAVPTNSSQQDSVIQLDSNKVSKSINRNMIILFVHYSDSEKNLYTTQAIFRALKENGKIVNYLFKDNKVYQDSPIKFRLI